MWLAVMRLAARVPLRALHAIGAMLGWITYGVSPTYRRNLRVNLARAGLDDAPTRRRAVGEAGKMVLENVALWFRPHAQVAALVRSLEGEEQVRAALARGEALMFLAPHLGCFEITSLYAATLMPITVLYRPPKIAWLEPLMRAGRERGNVRLLPADLSGVREVLAALQRGEAVGFLPDQVPARGEGEWAEFFGRPAFTMTMAARLAGRPGIACFLTYGLRLPRGEGYRIVLRRLPPALAGESPTRRVNRAVEALIRECPEQYLWGYNRYKQPAGVAPASAA